MNLISSLRTSILLSLTAAALISGAHAADQNSAIGSRLATQGEIAVKEAGPYVQVGSYRIWVSSHLGHPASVLPDGTWLYRGYQADGSDVRGTLAVTFTHGQVASLKLLSNARTAEVTALQTRGSLVAAR